VSVPDSVPVFRRPFLAGQASCRLARGPLYMLAGHHPVMLIRDCLSVSQPFRAPVTWELIDQFGRAACAKSYPEFGPRFSSASQNRSLQPRSLILVLRAHVEKDPDGFLRSCHPCSVKFFLHLRKDRNNPLMSVAVSLCLRNESQPVSEKTDVAIGSAEWLNGGKDAARVAKQNLPLQCQCPESKSKQNSWDLGI
jgi:hypothetical protein